MSAATNRGIKLWRGLDALLSTPRFVAAAMALVLLTAVPVGIVWPSAVQWWIAALVVLLLPMLRRRKARLGTADWTRLPESRPAPPLAVRVPDLTFDTDFRRLPAGAYVDVPTLTRAHDIARLAICAAAPASILLAVVVYGVAWSYALVFAGASCAVFFVVFRRSSYVWYAFDDGNLVVKGWNGLVWRVPFGAISEVRDRRWSDRLRLRRRGDIRGLPVVVVEVIGEPDVVLSPTNPNEFVERLSAEVDLARTKSKDDPRASERR